MFAREPYLSEPDTKSAFADFKYKTRATAAENFAIRFQKTILNVAATRLAGQTKVHLPWKMARDGALEFIFKSPHHPPRLLDSKGKALPHWVKILDGSLIRVAGVIAAWQKGSMSGVSLWPDAVRVIKLSEGCNPCEAFGPPEDGYDATADR